MAYPGSVKPRMGFIGSRATASCSRIVDRTPPDVVDRQPRRPTRCPPEKTRAVAPVTVKTGYAPSALAVGVQSPDREETSMTRVNDQDLEAWPQWHALRVGGTLFN